MSDVSDVGLTSSWGEGGCIFVGAVTQVVVWVVVVAVDVLKEIPGKSGSAVLSGSSGMVGRVSSGSVALSSGSGGGPSFVKPKYSQSGS